MNSTSFSSLNSQLLTQKSCFYYTFSNNRNCFSISHEYNKRSKVINNTIKHALHSNNELNAIYKGYLRINRVHLKKSRIATYAAARESYNEPNEEKFNLLGLQLSSKELKIVGFAILTTILAVVNRILYKMALIPLKNYPFFLAQMTTIGYVCVYFPILLLRYRMGKVTVSMLNYPKLIFVFIGALEALSIASGMASAAMLPGAVIPIITKTYLIWQMILSFFILKKKYNKGQLLSSSMVLFGILIVVSNEYFSKKNVSFSIIWSIAMVVSTFIAAMASITKEFVFKDAEKRLEDGKIDLFVVNSFGSLFQAIFVFLLLPFLSQLRGVHFFELPQYFQASVACFLNTNYSLPECMGSPFFPLLYVCINMMYNISALNLIQMSSAVVASLSSTFTVPLTVLIFTFPLPLIGNPSSLSLHFFMGTSLLILGLISYNFFTSKSKIKSE